VNLLDPLMAYCYMFVLLNVHEPGKCVMCNEVIFIDCFGLVSL
jgi:hypothetical protein